MYNGHRSWNAWNVSLWINNDESLYNLARECIRARKRHGENKDGAAQDMLRCLPTATRDGAPYTFTTVRAAIRGID